MQFRGPFIVNNNNKLYYTIHLQFIWLKDLFSIYARVFQTVNPGPKFGPLTDFFWAPNRLFLGPLGLKYMHWIWAFGP